MILRRIVDIDIKDSRAHIPAATGHKDMAIREEDREWMEAPHPRHLSAGGERVATRII